MPKSAVKATSAKAASKPTAGKAKPKSAVKSASAKAAVKAKAKRADSGSGGKRRARGFGFISFILLLLTLGGIAVGVWRVNEYQAFAEMKREVSKMTFGAGVTVEGVDVSEMTLDAALEYWNTSIEPRHREVTAVLNDGTSLTAAQMGYSSDCDRVLFSAWSAGKRGSLVERYQNLSRRRSEPRDYPVTRVYFDPARVEAFVQSAAAQIDRAPTEAGIKSFDPRTTSFQFQEGAPGYRLNRDRLAAEIASALASGGGAVTMQVERIEPTTTTADIESQYGLIAYAVTNASSSSSNRLSNIRLAMSIIDGACLMPGETFSFNQTVGQRTKARGFKMATAYSGGAVTEEVGGGICQVSTTLFNAAVKANLKIVERHPHSLPVSYVDAGKDAAVDWGNKDMRFANNGDSPVYICCALTDDKRIRIGVFGKLLPDGMSITVESKKTEDVKFETEYQVSFTMDSGATRVLQEGKNGSKAVTYKVLRDADGNELRREELCRSAYLAKPQIIEYGP